MNKPFSKIFYRVEYLRFCEWEYCNKCCRSYLLIVKLKTKSYNQIVIRNLWGNEMKNVNFPVIFKIILQNSKNCLTVDITSDMKLHEGVA